MKSTVNNAGNADDVKNYIRCGLENKSLTAEKIKDALDDERAKQNRSSIIQLLERALKKLQTTTKK